MRLCGKALLLELSRNIRLKVVLAFSLAKASTNYSMSLIFRSKLSDTAKGKEIAN